MEFLVLFISCFSLFSYTNSQFPNIPNNVPLSNIPQPNVPLPNVSFPTIPVPNVSLPNISFPNVSFPNISLPNTTLPEIKFENYDPRALVDQLPGYGKTWMYFPDGRGIPTIVQLEVDEVRPRHSTPVNKLVTFHLYTRLNPNTSDILEYGNETTIANSDYDVSRPTKFVIHGWASSYKSDTCQTIKDNFLESDDYNVILVDWENIASNIIYPISALETQPIGDFVGQMLDYLVDNGAKVEDFHLIGHSLGAHIAGRAGHAVKSGKIERVTGLDPALPGFEIVAPNENKLDKSDAKFVDVIHTCGGVLGYYSKIGHVDFYPNGGTPSQPGCFGVPQIIEGCSHGRAWQYFAESILAEDGFIATQCDSWDKYKTGGCSNNTRIQMGYGTPTDAKGLFYLRTNDKAPFVKSIFEEIFDRKEEGLLRKIGRHLPFIG